MRILHTVNKSPFTHQQLTQCLARFERNNDALLLLEDGIYGALKHSPQAEIICQLPHCYAIAQDISSRGLQYDALLKNIQCINYEGFVKLAVDHPLSHSWY